VRPSPRPYHSAAVPAVAEAALQILLVREPVVEPVAAALLQTPVRVAEADRHAADVHLGFGRVFASAKEVPNMLAIPL
jgi:hypothetical protein